MARVLSDTAERILDALPPYLQNSIDVQGVIAALASEVAELDTTVEAILGTGDGAKIGQLFPRHSNSGRALSPTAWTATTYTVGSAVTYKGSVYEATSAVTAADVPVASSLWRRVPHAERMRWLPAWERLLNIAVDSTKTDAQRLANVQATLLTLKNADSATVWKSALDTLIGANSWSYIISANALTVYLPYGIPLVSPTALTVGSPTSGGSLTAGKTYYYTVTAYNAYGETAAVTPVVAGAATTSTNKQIALSWTAPATGSVTGYYIYRGESATSLSRLNTTSGTSFTDIGSGNFTTGPIYPTGPSSVVSSQQIEALRLIRRITPAHITVAAGYAGGFILNVSTLGSNL